MYLFSQGDYKSLLNPYYKSINRCKLHTISATLFYTGREDVTPKIQRKYFIAVNNK